MFATCSSGVKVNATPLRGWHKSSSTTTIRSLAAPVRRSNRRVAPTSFTPRAASTDASDVEPLLVIIECDGVLCDVHLDGHREAFNEAFKELNMEGASWDQERYLSLLRTGGGTAEGMVERYFHFYGYPSPELRDPSEAVPDETSVGGIDLPEDATPLMKAAAAAQAAEAAQDPLNKELLQRRRREWIDEVVRLKDVKLQNMIAEGRLKLRKGAVHFLDECLLEDGVQVVIIGATASSPEEGVLDAVLEAIGPLRAAAISVSDGNESIDGTEMKNFEGFKKQSAEAADPAAATPDDGKMDDDALDGFGEHVGLHDAAWEEAKKTMQAAMKARKGELLAQEVGGDLQRQSFDANVIVDTGVFTTSTRSVISSSAIKGMLESKDFTPDRALFIGASRSTCSEANGAGVFNALCRTANQAESQITGVACVVDGFGAGGGLTLRYVKSRMSSWTPGETVGHKEI